MFWSDTNYLVNKHRMLFASFVGVNHHCQCCALISHENVYTSRWLFSSRIYAMGGVHPMCILTNVKVSRQQLVKSCLTLSIVYAYDISLQDT